MNAKLKEKFRYSLSCVKVCRRLVKRVHPSEEGDGRKRRERQDKYEGVQKRELICEVIAAGGKGKVSGRRRFGRVGARLGIVNVIERCKRVVKAVVALVEVFL